MSSPRRFFQDGQAIAQRLNDVCDEV